MKKKLLTVILFLAVLISCSGSFTVSVSAAAKPAAAKKKVTLFTDSPKYTIELKNVKSSAKITYKSSDKSVVTVKKGVVTPKGEGKATVTVTVKQKKTYTIKIKFTIKSSEAEETEPELSEEVLAANADYDIDIIERSNRSVLTVSERAVLEAVKTGNTDNLDDENKALYNRVVLLARALKGSSEYDTVRKIHDYLVENTEYAQPINDSIHHSLKAALLDGVCVCDGYSKAFYYLCVADGVEAIIMTGSATSTISAGPHAWNKVKIEDKWYSIDVTWDDPIKNYESEDEGICYDYFLVTDKDIAINHNWDDKGFPDAVLDDLGIVYAKYRNYPKFEGLDDTLEYVNGKVDEYVRNGVKGNSVKLSFLVSTDHNAVYSELISIMKSCYNNYGCGYNYKEQSAGFYGWEYYFEVNH